ncbi:MAG TPA: alpha/beta fold hydrolase [Candidatus Polarisedimenticolaceae bacterium]|nr:alpha/beta fold hydrolase [Candidatus Polarisedimenticolaceae bacterium]
MSTHRRWMGCALFVTLALGFASALVAETAPPALRRRAFFGARFGRPGDPGAPPGIAADAKGLQVFEVFPDTPAARAGVQGGDAILEALGQPIDAPPQFIAVVGKLRAGDALELTLLRAGEPKKLTVTLGELPIERSDAIDIAYGAVVVREQPLRTVLTRPKGGGAARPAVLLVQDSPCLSVEDPRGFGSPYRKLAHELSVKGFVTMRLEKSGVGDSLGPACPTTDFDTEVAGFRSALAALRTEAGVDPARVFLVGQGTGGTIAGQLAAETAVRGVVALGATARPWPQYVRDGVERGLRFAGEDAQRIQQTLARVSELQEALFVKKQELPTIFKEQPQLREALSRVLFAPSAPENEILGRHYRFWQQLAAQDLAAPWKRVSASVLVLRGSADYEASSEDARAIAAAVNQSRPGAAAFRELPYTDHFFMVAQDPQESFRAQHDGEAYEFSWDLVDVLAQWMNEAKG